MSGHSKWSKVKHQKGAVDIKRGQSFTKISNAISIAVRESGGIIDPEANFKLRLAIEKAKVINMPKENIERAIERGKGKSVTNDLQQVNYEGYGPGGIALLIEVATDNRLRTTQEIKSLLETYGGNLAGPGSVVYNFKTQGIIEIKKGDFKIEEVLDSIINSGAEDFEEETNSLLIYTQVEKLKTVKDELIKKGITIASTEISMKPLNLIPINNLNLAAKIITLVKKLEELDDVQEVYTNFDIPKEIINQLAKS